MKLLIKIPGNYQSDMVSNKEILSFLQHKVAEKYPQGEVEETEHFIGEGTSFQIRTSAAAIGVYNTVSCAVEVWRKKDGRLLVQVNVGDSDGSDMVQQILMLSTMRKRSALVEEVAGWITPFLQEKQNQFCAPRASSTKEQPDDAPSRKCDGCGAEIPDQDSVCPYCGANIPGNVRKEDSTPVTQLDTTQQSSTQAPAKSKTTYVLLGVLLGGLGIHNFYAGYKGKGIAQLLITVLTAGYGGMLSWIWAIIEICTVKQDAKGIPFA